MTTIAEIKQFIHREWTSLSTELRPFEYCLGNREKLNHFMYNEFSNIYQNDPDLKGQLLVQPTHSGQMPLVSIHVQKDIWFRWGTPNLQKVLF